MKIFISYRRADSRKDAGRIYDRLVEAFGKDNIFKDIDSIPMGSDFRGKIREAVAQCDVQLAIIGRQWLEIKDENGNCRLNNPGDFVRLEIESALQRDNCLVIPVLVDNATMPSADELPTDLRELAFRNATVARDDPDFHSDVSKIIRDLRRHPVLTPEPTSEPVTIQTTPFDVHAAISNFYKAFDTQDWEQARQTLTEIRVSGQAPRVFDIDAHEQEMWAVIEAEEQDAERDKEYALLRVMFGRRSRIRVWEALQIFWQTYPDYDPDGMAEILRPVDPVAIALQQAQKFTGTRNRDWMPFVATFNELKLSEMSFCLIPVGSFQMGADDLADAQPVHSQTVSQPYYIAQFPVTNAQWAIGVKAGVVNEPEGENALKWYHDLSMVNAPVVGVTWFDANTFVNWLGCRLPSELEWEYAARGVENLLYPWGNEFKPDFIVWNNNSDGKPAEVQSKPEGNSWADVSHLTGNVWEWTSSFYELYPYRANRRFIQDTRDKTDGLVVLRGGSWSNGLIDRLRASYRDANFPDYRDEYVGFRCAHSLT